MRLAKITDAAKTGRNDNLTVRRLVETIVPEALSDYQNIESLIEDLEEHGKRQTEQAIGASGLDYV